jgi:hypothetical protein
MIMKLSIAALLVVLAPATAFAPRFALTSRPSFLSMSTAATMAEAGVPPSTSDASEVAEIEIPTSLPSEKGIDYVPLATMLATGQLAEADQVCDM